MDTACPMDIAPELKRPRDTDDGASSPKRLCVSLGKQRHVYIVAVDLSASMEPFIKPLYAWLRSMLVRMEPGKEVKFLLFGDTRSECFVYAYGDCGSTLINRCVAFRAEHSRGTELYSTMASVADLVGDNEITSVLFVTDGADASRERGPNGEIPTMEYALRMLMEANVQVFMAFVTLGADHAKTAGDLQALAAASNECVGLVVAIHAASLGPNGSVSGVRAALDQGAVSMHTRRSGTNRGVKQWRPKVTTNGKVCTSAKVLDSFGLSGISASMSMCVVDQLEELIELAGTKTPSKKSSNKLSQKQSLLNVLWVLGASTTSRTQFAVPENKRLHKEHAMFQATGYITGSLVSAFTQGDTSLDCDYNSWLSVLQQKGVFQQVDKDAVKDYTGKCVYTCIRDATGLLRAVEAEMGLAPVLAIEA